MKTKLMLLFGLIMIGNLNAQDKKSIDRQAIKNMCGCYEVTFNFAETFNYSQDSLYAASPNTVSYGLEWTGLITDEDNKIVIQHILQVGNPDNPSIVKHWRQDWLFENQDFYIYQGDNNWTYTHKAQNQVKGQWTQKVYQVDDSPRYEGSATWVHVDGKSFWENTTPAPLPRREYTIRNDYNITLRGNRHEITDFGWVHEQDNKKIIRQDGNDDLIIAQEKGYNTYKKVDDSRCAAAASWWKKNEGKWHIVRSKWHAIFDRKQDLSLAKQIDEKPLFQHLFSQEKQDEKSIEVIIESFVKKP